MRIMAFVILSLLASPAGAFHEHGVARCNACHTMHNSQDGFPVNPDHPEGRSYLLTYDTPSDLCLSCHGEDNGAVFGLDPLMPPPEMGGGNFVFLLEDNLNDAPDGAANPISGDAAGHNIDAPSRGVGSDGTYPHSPGGNYPSSRMGCTSCHDPHGNGNFRMLYGVGPVGHGSHVFTYPAPLAIGIDLNSAGESRDNHSAYLRGMSRWCGNCHGDYLDEHAGNPFEHDTEGSLDNSEVDHYNRYNGDADPDGGFASTAYLPEVPFEDLANLPGSPAGPSYSSELSCMTCHRAHASSAPRAGRWDFTVRYLSQDGVISGSHPIPDPYEDPEQMHLCHKCHTPGDDHEPGAAKN